MKKNLKLPLWLIPVVMIQAAPAAVNINGTTDYSQDFNTLPTATTRSEFTWTDNSTIPGFYLHRSNPTAGEANLAGTLATPGSRPYVSAGQVAASTAPIFHGFLSLGTLGTTERALGFSATGADSTTNWAGGALSIIGIFTNTGTRSVDVTDVGFDLENWFGNNNNPRVPETITCTFKTGDAAALLAELTAPSTPANSQTFTQPGYNPLNGGTFDVLSADGFNTPAAPGTTEKSASLSPHIRLAPGQSLVLRWGNVNDSGADAQVGIDNLFIHFQEVAAAVVPTVTNIVRNDMGTPTIASDDKVDFTLTVDGLGSVGPGWKISAPFSLSTITGSYAVAQNITGVDIGEFSSAGHTMDLVVEDQTNPVSATVTVAAPWGSITPVVTNVTRDDKGNDTPVDDTWSYSVTVNGTFVSAAWNSDNPEYFNGAYGTTRTVLDRAMATPTDSATFTDSVDTSITASITVSPPRVIGRKNFGVEEKLMSDTAGVPAQWVVDETALTQRMNDLTGGPPAKVYRSEVIDLTSVDEVKFTGSLFVQDASSGCEPADTFNAQLIIDGTTTVSLITPFDTLVPANGVLTGAEITPAVPGPPPTTGGGNFTHNFTAVIPASANSVQLVISGNNDSPNEVFTVQNLLFELGSHSIITTPGGVQFDNKGTLATDDDEYRLGLNIFGVSPPPGSTGWTGTGTPNAGLYSDPQPVLFGPFLQSAGPQEMTLTDNNVPAVTTIVPIVPPTPAIVATFVEGVVFRGNTWADDTTRLTFAVSAPVGSTEFAIDSHPLIPNFTTRPLTATPTNFTFTFSGAVDHGNMIIVLSDVGYPASRFTFAIPIPVGTTEYILGKTDFGAGVNNFQTPVGIAPPTQWQNTNNPPAVIMNNGGTEPAKVLTSEVINLTTVGAARFTATLHIRDTSSGFEADDTFLAQLIYNGNTAAPISLITPHDTNGDGVLSGNELCPAPAAGVTVQNREYTLSADIPEAVNSVQLVLTALNDSGNETIYVENALFALPGSTVDTDLDGMPDDYEDANGLNKNSSADKDLDLDGDGQSNLNEFLAGTSANNAASVFRITSSTKTGTSASVTWSSVPGTVYRIEFSPTLETWTDAGMDFPAATGPATQTTATVTIPGAGLLSKHYLRVRVK